jgi:hypothetical protein
MNGEDASPSTEVVPISPGSRTSVLARAGSIHIPPGFVKRCGHIAATRAVRLAVMGKNLKYRCEGRGRPTPLDGVIVEARLVRGHIQRWHGYGGMVLAGR